jgi:hypothetical protein
MVMDVLRLRREKRLPRDDCLELSQLELGPMKSTKGWAELTPETLLHQQHVPPWKDVYLSLPICSLIPNICEDR